ncbi:MAG: hypothetical protein COB41_05565 [Proteobacteria bacterium]|nr:MAG: hypothetical protein COB41_05565 [Pseudomonadota bacterium]
MAQLMLVNPKKRTKKKKRLSSVTKVTKRYRRNPVDKAAIGKTAMAGGVGAAGALAVDVAMAKLPIPENLKTGSMAPVARGLVGIGLGMLVSKFGKKSLGQQVAQGAMTVALYSAGKNALGPSLGLSAYDYDDMDGYGDLMGFDDDLDLGDDLLGDDLLGIDDDIFDDEFD